MSVCLKRGGVWDTGYGGANPAKVFEQNGEKGREGISKYGLMETWAPDQN